jgi:hypothetical protein
MAWAEFLQNQMFPDAAAAEREREAEERQRQQRINRGQAAVRPGVTPGVQGPMPFLNFANAMMAPGMNAHSAAIGQVNDVISREMQSRVAQAREARRMQHEKDMKRMEIDAMLERVRQAGGR